MLTTPDAAVALKGVFAGLTDRASLDHPALNVPPADLLGVLRSLRADHGFDMLVDVAGIDWGVGAHPRFAAAYHVFSTVTHAYVRLVSACASDESPELPSAVGIWAAADWHEREAYDMYGIHFAGHPDLRRILMWDGYPHHPLRKDFPLAGVETPLPDAEITAEIKVGTIAAPMAGGPFVAAPGQINMAEAEPRAKDESWNERRPKPGA